MTTLIPYFFHGFTYYLPASIKDITSLSAMVPKEQLIKKASLSIETSIIDLTFPEWSQEAVNKV
jgi:hypothetical protein